MRDAHMANKKNQKIKDKRDKQEKNVEKERA